MLLDIVVRANGVVLKFCDDIMRETYLRHKGRILGTQELSRADMQCFPNSCKDAFSSRYGRRGFAGPRGFGRGVSPVPAYELCVQTALIVTSVSVVRTAENSCQVCDVYQHGFPM